VGEVYVELSKGFEHTLVRRRLTIEPGQRELDLEISRFTNLRAVRRADEAEVEAWWSDPRSFPTDAFALADFSPDAWDGPDRRDAIATLERSIAEQEEAERR